MKNTSQKQQTNVYIIGSMQVLGYIDKLLKKNEILAL